jgi:hypothetical protein
MRKNRYRRIHMSTESIMRAIQFCKGLELMFLAWGALMAVSGNILLAAILGLLAVLSYLLVEEGYRQL